MANVGKLVYRASGIDAGKLCYKASGADAGKLCYKSASVVIGGDITITVVSAYETVGPIQSCGNVHNVRITIDGTSSDGQVSKTFAAPNQSRSVSVTTQSSGCAYPNENPPMDFRIIAVQPSTGVVKSLSHMVSNVATGSFNILFAVDANKWLTSVEVS